MVGHLLTPRAGEVRQEGPWGSLASQPGLFGGLGLQAGIEPVCYYQKSVSKEAYPLLTFVLYMRVYTFAHTYTHLSLQNTPLSTNQYIIPDRTVITESFMLSLPQIIFYGY